jgi:hypothetical protein
VNEKGQKGWFPAARVVEATEAQRKHFDAQIKTLRTLRRKEKDALSPRRDEDNGPAPVTTSSAPDDEFPRATVLFDYTARSETELTVKAGKVVLIVSQDNADWWEAEIDGEVGYLPRTFVRFVEPEAAPSVPKQPAPQDDDEADKRKTVALTHLSTASGGGLQPKPRVPGGSGGAGGVGMSKSVSVPGKLKGKADEADDVPAPPARSAPPPPAAASSVSPALEAIKAVEALADEPPESLSKAEMRQHHALLAAAALRVSRELRSRLTAAELGEK